MESCDICQRPATFFYSYAACNASGGQAEAPKGPVSLCAEHAALHERAECQRTLARLLKGLEQYAQQAQPVQGVRLTIAAQDEQSAQNIRRAMLQLCGGESFIRSQIRMPLRWEVEWNSDATISVLDQWQTGGWSERLYDLIVGRGCKLTGSALTRPPPQSPENVQR